MSVCVTAQAIPRGHKGLTLTCAGLFGFVFTFPLADFDEADQMCTPQCKHCRLRKALADGSDLKISWVGTGCNRLFML